MRSVVSRAAAVSTAALLVVVTAAASAASGIRTERVQFAKGASSAIVEGTLRGDETVDYVLNAAKGQTMNVGIATKGSAFFNILAPGETNTAFFVGSVSGDRFEGVLPATGDYRIRVYQMRATARRGEVATYRLEMIVGGARPAASGHSAAPAAASAAGAKHATTGQFDATGQVPCARREGQPTGPCSFGVTRKPGGEATVVVTHPDGFKRTLYFSKGEFVGADTTKADGRVAFRGEKQGDLNLVYVGFERYEIPDAAITGG